MNKIINNSTAILSFGLTISSYSLPQKSYLSHNGLHKTDFISGFTHYSEDFLSLVIAFLFLFLFVCLFFNAAVNGKLELTLLKGRQRFDTVSTSNLKV